MMVLSVGCKQVDEDDNVDKEGNTSGVVGEEEGNKEEDMVEEEVEKDVEDESVEEDEIVEEEKVDLSGVRDIDEVLEKGSEEVKGALQLVVDNINFTEAKDMDNYIDTIVEDRQAGAREEAEYLFENYSMSYEVTGVEIVEESEDEVVLRIKQAVTVDGEVENETFDDYDTDMNYILVKVGEEWKLSSIEAS